MCGIAGIVRFGGDEVGPADLEDLGSAGDRLAHRGPDGQEVGAWGGVGVAFRRLAVYDIAGGRQPLWNERGTVGLAINGTIYNAEALTARLRARHRFATRSDCEPLVHLYEEHGSGLVDHLIGMFAFALWDLEAGKVLLGRDRLGQKPLYYTADRRRLLFGSEVKALLAFRDCPRELDWWEVLGDPTSSYALTLADEPLTTGFRDIRQLPGGSLLEVDIATGEVVEREYWGLPDPDPALGAAEAAARYEELLLETIDGCLTGEAAIGLALSGGVDSAIIAGRSAQVHPVHTLTIVTEATRANGDASGALEIAASLGLPHTQVLCEGAALLGDGRPWRDLVWRCESPLCGPEQLLKNETLKQAKATIPGLKVMLSGLGGDEFAGGYMTTFVGGGGTWPAFLDVLAGAAVREHRRRDRVVSVWDAFLGRRLLRAAGGGIDGDVHAAFQRRKRRDLLMYNLWCEDRLASAYSIEARAPYLDHRLVELLASIPADRHEALLADKRIIRDAGRSVLPPSLLERPKVPFFHGPAEEDVYRPFLDMLAADGYAMVEEALGGERARSVVDLDAVRSFLTELRDGGRSPGVATEMVLRLVNLGLLDGMVRAGGWQAAAGEPAPAITIERWTPESREIAELEVRPRAQDWAATTLAYAPGAQLVTTHHEPARSFLALDGRLRYEIDPGDPWLVVLQGVDGETRTGDLCARAGAAVDAVSAYIATAVEQGILTVAEPGERDRDGAAPVGAVARAG